MRRLSIAFVTGLFAACDYTSPDGFKPPVPKDDCVDYSTPQGYISALKCDALKSCAFQCKCAEPETPYVCPALRPWAAMEHASSCGSFDGSTTPAVVQGRCTASAPTGVAAKPFGPDADGRTYLPDGHWIAPAGHEQVLHGPGIRSAFLIDEVLIPNTKYAVAVDAGVADNAIYSVDLDLLATDKPALVSTQKASGQLDYGLAFVAPNRVYASGGADAKVYAYTIDVSGVLARDAQNDLDLGPSKDPAKRWYVGGLAASGDGTTLFVSSAVGEGQARIVDLTSKAQKSVDLGPSASELFGAFRDPYDKSGKSYWISALDGHDLLHIDASAGAVVGKINAGKNPEGVAFLGGTHLAAVFSDEDAIGVFEAVSGKLVQTLKLAQDALNGAQPGALAYDEPNKRLYCTLSGVNAIGVYAFDASSSAPLTPLGKVPTAWFPTGVRVRPDGSLVVINAKGRSTGPAIGANTPELTKGSIALISSPTSMDLSTMTAIAEDSRKTTVAQGFPTVSCNGTPYDFPVPSGDDGAPSAQIQHVIYVIRENKTFDSVFGDVDGVNGDKKLVMSPGRMDEYWHNARAIARAFTNFDMYGISAEQSLQGHVWTSLGRTTDWIERTWSATWGRNVRSPRAGIDRQFGSPAEGGLFTWLERNKVPYENMGEIIGLGDQGFDFSYPGLVYTQSIPDEMKSCYLAARARATCDLKSLSYVVMPNDHTKGTGSPTDPTPELMIAVNDVATGMLLDAVSHSPMWPTTLLIVTEDDPQDGYDHVDGHRTPLFMASPWIKRNYVSHTRIDTASLHKLFAHLFAKPYSNARQAEAALPYDAFTGTPDYTPYTYTPLQTKVSCNPTTTKSWSPPNAPNWETPDQTPWIRDEVMTHMRELGEHPDPAR